MIWGAAEVAITICAASVPLLRVLVREVRSITQQRRYGYHAASASEDAYHAKSGGVVTAQRFSTVIVSAGHMGPWKLDFNPGNYRGTIYENKDEDGVGSNADGIADAQVPGRILQTREITIQYHTRDGTAGDLV